MSMRGSARLVAGDLPEDSVSTPTCSTFPAQLMVGSPKNAGSVIVDVARRRTRGYRRLTLT